jgi:hypothetical protein
MIAKTLPDASRARRRHRHSPFLSSLATRNLTKGRLFEREWHDRFFDLARDAVL